MQQSEKFHVFLKENTFLQGYKVKRENTQKNLKVLSPRSKKILKQDDFFSSLNTCVNYFEVNQRKKKVILSEHETKDEVLIKPKIEEYSEQQIINSFQKSTRESEIRQQKKILLLHNKMNNLNNDIEEMKKGNKELFGDCKAQKHLIKDNALKKIGFDEFKIKQEKKILFMNNQINDNEALLKDLKPIINITLEDLDRMALSNAKKAIQQKTQDDLIYQNTIVNDQSDLKDHKLNLKLNTSLSQQSINVNTPKTNKNKMSPTKSPMKKSTFQPK